MLFLRVSSSTDAHPIRMAMESPLTFIVHVLNKKWVAVLLITKTREQYHYARTV